MNNKKQTIGFLDQGKRTTLIDCSSEGVDIGLKSEGEDLYAKNFRSINKKNIHNWYEKWWIKYLVFPVIVILIGTFIIYKLGFN